MYAGGYAFCIRLTFPVKFVLHSYDFIDKIHFKCLLSAAATKDGVKVVAVSATEVKESQGFGIINLTSPVTSKLSSLGEIVGSAYACTL